MNINVCHHILLMADNNTHLLLNDYLNPGDYITIYYLHKEELI